MMEVETALTHAHRSNIQRYLRLLDTILTDVERNYIELRLSEEQAVLHAFQSRAMGRLPGQQMNLE